MQLKWKKEHRRILMIGLLLLAVWSFLIYWQGDISWGALKSTIFAMLGSQSAVIKAPFDSIFIDLLIFIIGSFLSIIFFAHFVVPIQSKSQLGKVIRIMGNALIGRKPAAISLSNGSAINDLKDQNSKSVQIILLDIASASVLRNKSSFTRAIGPGIHFPDSSERIAGQLDLRIHRRTIGPLPSDEPFNSRMAHENEAEFMSREKRRGDSSGLTKDGVEIVPRLELLFRVQGKVSAGMAFPFQAEFAWRTIANEGIAPMKPSDVRNRQIGWDWLPAQLAVDLWRVFLRKYSLQEIFEEIGSNGFSASGGEKRSGLQQIERQINQRLKNALVERRGERKSSPEYQLLRNRGIQVLKLMIREVHIDPSRAESRLVNEWSENWELHAIQENISNSELREQEKSQAIRAAASEFIKMVSQGLLERLSVTDGENIMPPDEKESLHLLLESSFKNADTLPNMDAQTLDRLNELKNYAANRNTDAR
jgi:hypothetical protein